MTNVGAKRSEVHAIRYDMRKFIAQSKLASSQRTGMLDGQKLVPIYYVVFYSIGTSPSQFFGNAIIRCIPAFWRMKSGANLEASQNSVAMAP